MLDESSEVYFFKYIRKDRKKTCSLLSMFLLVERFLVSKQCLETIRKFGVLYK